MKEITTYLTFDGNCREAMQFYARCLNGDLFMQTFGEAKMGPESSKDRIMHARLAKGGATLMASDTMPDTPFQQGNNFSVSVGCTTVDEAEKVFAALSEKGKVTMALTETFWAHRFGMLVDKFGIQWMVNLDKPH
ncbi:VOC family protein [Bdellovibrio bacteriovorus]|uniref:VOC family protein n=2 Tax=Bdellovibrio TaxID=958 RepID=UPI0035A6AFCD